MKIYTRMRQFAFAMMAVFVWIPNCQCKSNHSTESELVDESDYFDGEEENGQTESEAQKRQHISQRSPQQQMQPLYSSLMVPNANVQPNPLRLPNVLSLPPGAPARWVQPMGNGLPANPNLPAAGQRFVFMPSAQTTGATKAPSTSQTRPQASTVAEPTVGRPWEQLPGQAPFGALPGTPLTATNGQRLIILPGKQSTPNADNSKQPRQQPFPQGSAERPLIPTTAQPIEKPTQPLIVGASVKTTQTAQIVRIQPTSQTQVHNPASINETGSAASADLDSGKPSVQIAKPGRPIGVHTTHGRLLLEPYAENFCDIRQYSDDQLSAKNLQRVEYFVANLTCSRYFFECAIGQTFLLNCTSKDQVFDINTVNCNFKYNVKACNEFDHILHCSISEECQKDEFACCAEPQQCLSYSKRCDGVADCNDGEDENNCPSCGVDEFPCVKSGKCISWDKRCNGIPDECFDQTNLDEQNCAGCPPEKFSCTRSTDGTQTPICIDINLRCNGIRDCPRGEDELNCKSKGQKYLLCENQKQSVSKEQWCDGYEDCLDGSDEKYCVY